MHVRDRFVYRPSRTQQRRGWERNPGPANRESSTATTAPSNHENGSRRRRFTHKNREICRKGAHLSTFSRLRLDPIKLAYNKPYTSSTGLVYNKAHCYAELAVSSPVVAETIASTRCTDKEGMARLTGPGKHGAGIYPAKEVTNPSTNRARHTAQLCRYPIRQTSHQDRRCKHKKNTKKGWLETKTTLTIKALPSFHVTFTVSDFGIYCIYLLN